MENAKVKAFNEALRPPSGDPGGMKRYIAAAVRALGERADADLARTMEIPAATVASWKKRGVMAEAGQTWMMNTLTDQIIQNRSNPDRESIVPASAVIELMVRTRGDPFQLGDDGRRAAASSLGGYLALARFLFEVHVRDRGGDQVSLLADLLEGAAIQSRSGRETAHAT